MRRILLFFIIWTTCTGSSMAQEDSVDAEVSRMVTLGEVIIRSDLDVQRFLKRIKNDTTFYKAFRNLRVLGFTALNDIRMYDKKGKMRASLQSRTRQRVEAGCREMEKLQERTSGNMYEKDGELNYYTARMYAALFFADGRICGENNIVKGIELSTRSKKGLEKHKEQLKMLFFNPGKKIPGIPFIGNKIDIFDPQVASLYDMHIDTAEYQGQDCYVFSIRMKPGLSGAERNRIVFNNIVTWFNTATMEIVGRVYDLSYNTGVYDFDVHMEVQLTKFGEWLVPRTIRYRGEWDVPLKKRERGIFTATLFDFTN